MNKGMWGLYSHFVEERHRVWLGRQRGLDGPWTDDEVITNSKFTNVFRILDRGSQFLFDMMSPEQDWLDTAFTAWAYRFTNRPEPWRVYLAEVGRPPVRADVEDGTFRKVFEQVHLTGSPIFSAAYRINSSRDYYGRPKIEWLLDLTELWWTDDDWTSRLLAARADAPAMIDVLSELPRSGPFMGMQIVTDIGYVDSSYDENSYVVEGPGSLLGSKYVELEPRVAFERAREQWDGSEVFIEMGNGVRHYPSLMDCQNTFCEFSKYVKRSMSILPKPYVVSREPEPARLPQHWAAR